MPGSLVDLASEFEGETRVVRGFRALDYDVPRGCLVTYFPEANALVPVGSRAAKSLTPAFKSVAVRITPASA